MCVIFKCISCDYDSSFLVCPLQNHIVRPYTRWHFNEEIVIFAYQLAIYGVLTFNQFVSSVGIEKADKWKPFFIKLVN